MKVLKTFEIFFGTIINIPVLQDASCLHSTMHNVVIVGCVARLANPVQTLHEVLAAVGQLKLIPSVERRLHSFIRPNLFDPPRVIRTHFEIVHRNLTGILGDVFGVFAFFELDFQSFHRVLKTGQRLVDILDYDWSVSTAFFIAIASRFALLVSRVEDDSQLFHKSRFSRFSSTFKTKVYFSSYRIKKTSRVLSQKSDKAMIDLWHLL